MNLRNERAFALLVTAAHLVVAVFAIAHHEMWRDELHSWVVARDASTPWELVRSHRYDGHPPLWYGILWIVTRITWRPIVMQIGHVAIASSVVYLVARFAPFGRLARALFPFGYFMAYEYAAISRGYGLAFLLVVLLCMHHKRRFERPWITAALLASLALTVTVATVVAAAYAAMLVVDVAVGIRRGERFDRRAAIPIVVAAVAGAVALWSAWPPADSTVARVGELPPLPASYAPTRLIAGMLPVPQNDFFFWNSNALLAYEPLARVVAPFAIVLGAWLVFVLSRDRYAAALFAIGTALLMFLFGAIYSGDVRHHGFFFVLFVMSAWLASDAPNRREPSRWTRVRDAGLAPTLAAILIVHVPAAAIALRYDTQYVFSSGKRAVDALRSAGLADAPIVAELDYPATAALGQLGPHAKALSVRNGKPFSFVQWTADRLRDPSDDEIVRFATRIATERDRDVALLTTRPLPPAMIDGASVVRIAELYDSMIEAENFYVYRVAPSR